jgi:hypothetical protein
MAVIHQTTMNPGKLELLAAWLPDQPWYLRGGRRRPELTRVGGFRLDDPAGEVGLEFMVVADATADDAAVFYQVPMTYRGQPLTGAEGALIGTSEHGVLGTRWIYDGAYDPVLIAQLVACIQGDAPPQAQSISDTPDPTISTHPAPGGRRTVTGSVVAANGPSGTDLRVSTAGPASQLILRVNRILLPDGTGIGEPGQPCLSATWRQPDGSRPRGVFVSASFTGRPSHCGP